MFRSLLFVTLRPKTTGLEDPESSSGSTARGAIGYIRRYRPAIVIWENVLSLDCGQSWKKSGKEDIFGLLNHLGYLVVAAVCNPLCAACPQSRSRWYVIAELSRVTVGGGQKAAKFQQAIPDDRTVLVWATKENHEKVSQLCGS